MMDCIVLAAGRSTRMKGLLTKVLHPIAGVPLVHFPVKAALEAGASKVIVVCSEETIATVQSSLQTAFGEARIECVIQAEARGTGDAVRSGIEHCTSETVGILCGDTPLVDSESLKSLWHALVRENALLAIQSCNLARPDGYGRIIRDGANRVVEIREHRDLRTDWERGLNEINSGVYVGKCSRIAAALANLKPNNDKGEYYLTDIVADIAEGALVIAQIGSPDSLLGVNDRIQLAEADRIMYRRIAERHMAAGVTVRGDARIDMNVEIGPDAIIEAGVSLRGATKVGKGTLVDVGCVVVDSTIGCNVHVQPYTVIEQSSVSDGALLGPFAHLRPGSTILEDVHIGNFVETKKTIMRRGSKANHLSYLGDGDIGEKANVGAGTIFCNYDGYNKAKTLIGKGAFIGSDSQLVAPVTIGEGAYVASGTTVTEDVPRDALAISRVRQENKEGYAIRLRERFKKSSLDAPNK